ncbi:ligand-binding protein SH3 [Mycobacterium colombiense]|uniref:Multidrug resistance protein Mmr n=1 Tax=Mycobacterium colombiense TaxID=339268 RepID=A0A1A2SBJ4_9MYCO|nr:multidrug efflux SMR transporter [Mycobacterium colombiense]OBH61566.1 ligand-binding protein SH3 [Mycobacterium colombiense]
MAWLVLIASGVLEAVWATALNKSDGFSRPGPSLVFLVAVGLSMTGLGIAMRTLPVGTSYAVWVGVGAALTVGYAMLLGDEPASLIRLVLIGGIVACVAGLKLAG